MNMTKGECNEKKSGSNRRNRRTVFIAIGGNPGVAMDGNDDHNGHSMDHSKIESGADFGKHVSDHAKSEKGKGGLGKKGFSGDHNPGKHHQGYSGIKNR